MNCVDFNLQPAAFPGEWDLFQQGSFLCHNCLKVYKGASAELYFFPDLDLTYHRHADGVFYRALGIGPKGVLEISPFDSVEEDVLQVYAIIPRGGDFDMPGGEAELRRASRAFFDAVNRQGRGFSALSVDVNLWDDDP